MTFPTASSQIYRNELGEVIGWDNPGYDDGPDPDDYYDWLDSQAYEDDDMDDDMDEQYGDDGDLRDHYGDPSEADDQPDHQCGGSCDCTDQTGDDLDDYEEEPEPQEPDSDEVGWQEYGRAEAYADAAHNEIEQGRWDDDPNPYEGTYSEM